MVSNMNFNTNGASPREGSSNSSTFWPAHQSPTMATICCSPPESVPASWPRRSRSLGKHFHDAVHVFGHLAFGRSAVSAVGAEFQVVDHRHVREDLPPFGNLRNTQPDNLVGGHKADILPRQVYGTACGRYQSAYSIDQR